MSASYPSHGIIGETTPAFYVGRRRQVGYGFGSLFRSLYRAAIPLFKSEFLPRASSFATDIARDVLAGHDLQSALKAQGIKHGEQALTDVVESITRRPRKSTVSTQTGSGIPRTMRHFTTTNGTTYPFAPIVVQESVQTVRKRAQRKRNATKPRKRRATKQPARARRNTRSTQTRRTVKRVRIIAPRRLRQRRLPADSLLNIE